MSLATLRYERAAPKTNESKQGIPIFDGTPAGFYEWEFIAKTRYHSTDDEDKWKPASKLCEGLTGESLKVAMALGVDKLSQNDGVLKLVEALRLHIFPMATAEARELFRAGQRPGILPRQVGEPFLKKKEVVRAIQTIGSNAGDPNSSERRTTVGSRQPDTVREVDDNDINIQQPRI